MAESFIEAVERVLGQRGQSWRSLHVRLGEISDTSAESWKRSVTRYRKGMVPTEKSAGLIARALEVPRSSLPPVSARRTADRLAELEDEVGRLTAIVEELAGRAVARAGRGGR